MSSFLRFGAYGFWCSDANFQTWCALLAESLAACSQECWAKAYTEKLRSEARSPHLGYLDAGVDHAIDEDNARRGVLLTATKRAMLELLKARELSLERLESLPHSEGVAFLRPLPTAALLPLVSAFSLLLDGTWQEDASTSPRF